MKEKFINLISIIKKNKKDFFELFILDFLSILIATIFYIITIKFIFFLIKNIQISLNLSFNLKPILFWFAIIWCFCATLATIIFHFITLYTINKNGRSMLIKDDE